MMESMLPHVFYGGAGMSFVAAAEASEAKSAARTTQRRADDLAGRLDRAMLACEAMWSILRDKLGVTDVELLHRINDLDLSDGRLDGKVRKAVVSCPQCKRTITRQQPKCMYRGQPVMHDPFS